MNFVVLLSSIGMPIAMVIGAIAGWRLLKRDQQAEVEQQKNGWRDDSLDDWRRERDAAAETERAARVLEEASVLNTGRAEEGAQTKRNQRIGG
jgi:hypothetical protein